MNQIDPQQLQQLLKLSVPENCKECKAETFEPIFTFRRIPKLAIGAPTDALLPIPGYRCTECKTLINPDEPEQKMKVIK